MNFFRMYWFLSPIQRIYSNENISEQNMCKSFWGWYGKRNPFILAGMFKVKIGLNSFSTTSDSPKADIHENILPAPRW